MTVYIILEHQLEYGDYNFSTIKDTRVVGVYHNREAAESYKASLQWADNIMVQKHHCDPCEYEIQEWEVTE